jgi:hypothetical protein
MRSPYSGTPCRLQAHPGEQVDFAHLCSKDRCFFLFCVLVPRIAYPRRRAARGGRLCKRRGGGEQDVPRLALALSLWRSSDAVVRY